MRFMLFRITLASAIGVSILLLTFTAHVRNRPVSTDVLRNGNDNTALTHESQTHITTH